MAFWKQTITVISSVKKNIPGGLSSRDVVYIKQKTVLHCSTVIGRWESDSPLNLVRTEASGTSVHMARSTVHDCLDPLHIGLPGSVGTSVGVGNLNTKGNALATIITLRHSCTSYPNQSNYLRPNKRLDMITEIEEKSKCFFGKILVF